MKKLLCILLTATMAFSLVACAEQGASTDVLGADENAITPMEDLVASGSSNEVGYQLEMPEDGEEIAVITTNMGVFKMRFFPEEAPKAVYSFKQNALEGYYNGIIFHRVMYDFMIQGGDPLGVGTGGESIWDEPFEDEFSEKVFNIRGSVAMANSGPNTNGSQFFVNTAATPVNVTMYAQYLNDKVTEDIADLYLQNGGNVHLDGALSASGTGHTVFGQVFEGMDTVDKISQTSVNSSSKPVEDMVIEKIEIVIYEEEAE